VLGHPTTSPYGNPIPGLSELGETPDGADGSPDGLVTLDQVPASDGARVVVRRLAEPLQSDTVLMSRLRRAGVQPGEAVTVATSPEGLLVGSGGEATEITPAVAAHVFVTAP
jgi:DtxR family Mn-dependent transcriptional regulator